MAILNVHVLAESYQLVIFSSVGQKQVRWIERENPTSNTFRALLSSNFNLSLVLYVFTNVTTFIP